MAVIPELVRAKGGPVFRKRLIETFVVVAAMAGLWGAVVMLLPTSMGALVLGATWESASGLRLPYLVQYVAMVPYTVLLAYYRSAQANQLSTLMRATLAMLTLVLPLALAYAGGTVASAWAFALAVAVAAVVGGIATIVSRSRSRAQSARAQSASHGPDPVEVELRPAADAR
jgi:O-antigen/teichoic acid export membrane protein